MAKPDPLLVVDGARRDFGGMRAVDVEHLEVQRGVITGLIGPNGAGKTTLFNLLTGFDRTRAGRWRFEGKDVAGLPPHRLARRGMVRTFQLTRVLARMTVLENMMLGAVGQRGERLGMAMLRPLWWGQEGDVRDQADTLLERFLLSGHRDTYAGYLSGGQRKLLEVARALMVDPALILLDEPMAGVNPALRQDLLGHIAELRDAGRTVLFVEHDMDVVMEISDWVVCMAQGQIIAEGPPAAVAGNEQVIDAYLGSRHQEPSEGNEDG
ncbi:MAG: ABC transporter ATP-binding protein [Pseudonocardia sp.]|nr:ABC transporter ATP-binding protein [Pseudonocardia sp.]